MTRQIVIRLIDIQIFSIFSRVGSIFDLVVVLLDLLRSLVRWLCCFVASSLLLLLALLAHTHNNNTNSFTHSHHVSPSKRSLRIRWYVAHSITQLQCLA